MRIKDHELQAIKECIRSRDPDVRIYLFGSRVSDREKGGDIDLLLLSKRLNYDDKIKIRQTLYETIGEQKIDIVIAEDTSDPFVKMAMEQGVLIE